jgi:hypothetical protein
MSAQAAQVGQQLIVALAVLKARLVQFLLSLVVVAVQLLILIAQPNKVKSVVMVVAQQEQLLMLQPRLYMVIQVVREQLIQAVQVRRTVAVAVLAVQAVTQLQQLVVLAEMV